MTEVAVALTAALAVLALVYAPKRAADNVAALRRDLETDPKARERFYVRALFSIPLVVALYVLVVAAGGESWRDAGISWDEGDTLRAVPVSVLALTGALVVVAIVATVLDKKRPGLTDAASEATKVLAPATRRERALWPAVSLTAGVTEELLYRGLFVLHLHALVPALPTAVLVVASAVAFGIAHRYQGTFGVISSGVLGLAFGVVAVVLGNVLVVVALHTFWDIVAGSLKRE